MKKMWGAVASHLWLAALIIFLLIIIAVLFFNNFDIPGEKVFESLTMTVLTSAFGACAVGLVFEYKSLNRLIGEENVRSVLETVFNPSERIYGVIPETDLFHFGCVSVAAANGINIDDDRYGLVEACLTEVSGKLKFPYRRMDINRIYNYDPRYPSVVHVHETTTATYINKRNEKLTNQVEWRTVRTPVLHTSNETLPENVDILEAQTFIIGQEGSAENSEFPNTICIPCIEENGQRVWRNLEVPRFTIPAKCEDMKLQTIRSFYISISDCESQYTWPEPIRSLSYSAQFIGRDAKFSPSITGCCKCGAQEACEKCSHGVAFLSDGKNRVNVTVKDWTGSQTKLNISWSLLD